MRPTTRFAAATLLALATFSAPAQQASKDDVEAVDRMLPCLAQGLPEDWRRLEVTVELDSPGATTGSVSYKVAKTDVQALLDDFRPCDAQQPVEILLELRDKLPPGRRAWVRARLSLQPDGRFGLRYDYTK